MKITKVLVLIIALLCIFLGVLTPLNLIMFVGIGLGMILISIALPKTSKKIKEKID